MEERSLKAHIQVMAAELQAGAKRDDVYHAAVRLAARNKLDRYQLWLAIQNHAEDR